MDIMSQKVSYCQSVTGLTYLGEGFARYVQCGKAWKGLVLYIRRENSEHYCASPIPLACAECIGTGICATSSGCNCDCSPTIRSTTVQRE